MHYVTFCHLDWACFLFFNNKNNKSYIFGNYKGPLTPKVKLITLISLNTGTEEMSVNGNKVTYLKK